MLPVGGNIGTSSFGQDPNGDVARQCYLKSCRQAVTSCCHNFPKAQAIFRLDDNNRRSFGWFYEDLRIMALVMLSAA